MFGSLLGNLLGPILGLVSGLVGGLVNTIGSIGSVGAVGDILGNLVDGLTGEDNALDVNVDVTINGVQAADANVELA
ncbi:MAG: hypothetical protein RBR65_05260 [Aliarcobacter sp.]|jgi:hypothetical protein|nr:hypothetical protein [Aliarcobacter sp.]